ncbi:glycerol kinase GlpK [Aquirhabdus parva]|uniref:Glycerol kinase n=1 Tax=Aquirhabdus parva TaxID=2283318 RepID=A0A345P3Q3_9GAMM|nr:glycerol kinase GlpK [Aquirhabdus parva]AXI01912.1 glycerol kinase [Aquirhabdus parva]
MTYLLALDQGTTSSRAIVFNDQGNVMASAQREITLSTPHAGWVEQNALELWQTQIGVAQQAIVKAGLLAQDIAAIGLTNQRETTIIWNKKTGQPIAPAIVWQDRRTAEWCESLRLAGHEPLVQQKTGLRLDPYFSAGKLVWLLDHIPKAREQAQRGELAFGTVDSWLLWNLTRGARHVIDMSNASRTLLMNLHTRQWDDELLELFNIPRALLPEIVPSGGLIGETADGLLGRRIPLTAALGDQQAALFGQSCFKQGMAKNTYGTGCFMLMNTGPQVQISQNQLLSTLAWQTPDQTTHYALEGSVFMAGAIVQWLRDGLNIIRDSSDVEKLASQVPDCDGVVLVPAFTGLGAPYWDSEARGMITGMTRGTNRFHIARAALEAIAFQVADVLTAMQHDAHGPLTELRVDGGASGNDMLMQFQADLLGVPVLRPVVRETTALGAALMAGLGAGIFKSVDELSGLWQLERRFEPSMDSVTRASHLERWHRAVARARS